MAMLCSWFSVVHVCTCSKLSIMDIDANCDYSPSLRLWLHVLVKQTLLILLLTSLSISELDPSLYSTHIPHCTMCLHEQTDMHCSHVLYVCFMRHAGLCGACSDYLQVENTSVVLLVWVEYLDYEHCMKNILWSTCVMYFCLCVCVFGLGYCMCTWLALLLPSHSYCLVQQHAGLYSIYRAASYLFGMNWAPSCATNTTSELTKRSAGGPIWL